MIGKVQKNMKEIAEINKEAQIENQLNMSISSSNTSPNHTIASISMRPSNPFLDKSAYSRSELSVIESARRDKLLKIQRLSDVDSNGKFETPEN